MFVENIVDAHEIATGHGLEVENSVESKTALCRWCAVCRERECERSVGGHNIVEGKEWEGYNMVEGKG